MRSFEIGLLVLGLPVFAGCDDSPTCAEGGKSGDGTVHTLQFVQDDSSGTPTTLRIANDTLVFPLALRETSQSLTQSSLGICSLRIRGLAAGSTIRDPGSGIGRFALFPMRI
jgi:hypothetical protein